MTNDVPRLEVGDRCVLLWGTTLRDVIVSEVSVYLSGERSEFALYRVKLYDGNSPSPPMHRSGLFKLPGERQLLIDRLENDIEGLQSLLRVQEREQEIEDEAAIPHGSACECETCRMERARDAAEEQRR